MIRFLVRRYLQVKIFFGFNPAYLCMPHLLEKHWHEPDDHYGHPGEFACDKCRIQRNKKRLARIAKSRTSLDRDRKLVAYARGDE